MRITKEQQRFFNDIAQQYIPGVKVYLFGSRVDDSKRGGDIDVLLVGSRKLDFIEKHKIIIDFWKRFGEQKVDLVSYKEGEVDAFFELVFPSAMELK